MIVVGVAGTEGGCERDLTPTELEDRPGGSGSAKFLAFRKDELRPRIEGGLSHRAVF